jgi:hypothetical protein
VEGGVSAAERLTSTDLAQWGVVPASVLPDRGESSLLPVAAQLADMLPQGGLPRGATVTVTGSRSLLLALLAEPTAWGLWAAAVGLPDLGLVVAAELGVDLDRLALVPDVGERPGSVLGALTDGFDLIALNAGAVPEEALRRRVTTRVRHRGAVLLVDGDWPGASLTLAARLVAWYGLDGGHGYLASYELEIRAGGKGPWRRHRLQIPTEARADPGGASPALAVVTPG